jgi:hypothetical protein
MVFVNLRFAGRGLLPDVVNWVPDRLCGRRRDVDHAG